MLGQKLQGINEAEASMIASGSLNDPDLDPQLVHNEQLSFRANWMLSGNPV